MRADDWKIDKFGSKYKITYFKTNSGPKKRTERSLQEQLHDLWKHNSSGLVRALYDKYGDNINPVWNDAFQAFKTVEDENAKKSKVFNKNEIDVENSERFINNIHRAKGKIYEYALCNEFTHFCTLTQDGAKRDRYSLQQYIKDFGQMVRDANKLTPHNRISYVLVPEMHDDGAFHMHGLLKGVESTLYTNEHGHLDWSLYRKRFGFCCIEPIRDKNACAAYMTKYVTKDLAKTISKKGAHLFYASHGLNTKECVEIVTDRRCPVNFEYENDYVKIAWLSEEEFNELTI